MLISLASFVLALKTYRRAGARVRVAYEVGTITDNRLKGGTKEVPVIVIHVTNSGMTSIRINEFLLRPPTIIRFLRNGPYLMFDEGFDVEGLDGKKLPTTLRPNRTMDWAYRIKSAGLAGGWRAPEGSPLVTDLPGIYDRIRKSKIEVTLGNGRIFKRMGLTYGAIISLGSTRSRSRGDQRGEFD
jgi:hypothetical protein